MSLLFEEQAHIIHSLEMRLKKMLPIGPMMIEHRLIERMISLMGKELDRIKTSNKANPSVIDTIVDFMRTYADHCHHGKEENILFRELKKKDLSAEHKSIMDELIEETTIACLDPFLITCNTCLKSPPKTIVIPPNYLYLFRLSIFQ